MATDYQGNSTLVGDTTFGVARPYYATSSGVQALSSNMEFFTISTAVDIRTSAQSGGSLQSQMNLNKLIEIVSLRGQPILMGAIVQTGGNYYTVPMVTEHAGAWANVGATALRDRIVADGVNYGFGINANGVNDVPSTGTGGGLAVALNNPQILT